MENLNFNKYTHRIEKIQSDIETLSGNIKNYINDCLMLIRLDPNLDNIDKNKLIRQFTNLLNILENKGLQDSDNQNDFGNILRETIEMKVKIENSQITDNILNIINLLKIITEMKGA